MLMPAGYGDACVIQNLHLKQKGMVPNNLLVLASPHAERRGIFLIEGRERQPLGFLRPLRQLFQPLFLPSHPASQQPQRGEPAKAQGKAKRRPG